MVPVIEREKPISDLKDMAIPKMERPVAIPQKTIKALHITTTDPAGAGYALCQALQRHTDVDARIFTSQPNVFAHPEDIGTCFDYYDELEALLTDADILHFHKITEDFEITLPNSSSRKRSWRIKDFVNLHKKKKLVYHIHGHPFERKNYIENGFTYSQKNARVLASTPDLEELYRPHCNVQWFPNCVPQDDMLYVPRGTNKMLKDKNGLERLIVAHTVSVASLKNVSEIENAVAYVARTQPLNYLRLENMDFQKVMRVKRHAHLIFDHMQGYYGLGSLEGFALGKPVLAGLNDHCRRTLCEFWGIGDSLPWQIVRTEQELKDTLMDLTVNHWMRDVIGKRSREFMTNIWSDRNVAERLAQFYKSL